MRAYAMFRYAQLSTGRHHPPERQLGLGSRQDHGSFPRPPVGLKDPRTPFDLDVAALGCFPSDCDSEHKGNVVTKHSIFAGYVSYPTYPRWFAPRNRRS
jgi:hypothetical protein